MDDEREWLPNLKQSLKIVPMQQCEDFAKTFSALGDKTRFRLYQLLGEKTEICVSQLARELDITPACVSQHMKILAEAGLVSRVRDGQRVCYEVAADSPSKIAIQQLVFNQISPAIQ